jgi:peptide deformylase
MIRPIITYPNTILDQKAEAVSFPLDQQTKQLIDDMWETVKGKGIGLAAPQVGVSKQICIINMAEAEVDEKATNVTLINPVISFESQVQHLMVEGCLSFPGEYYEIWRPANITVDYYDIKGRKHKLRAKNWLSRIIQHEVSHLNGQLFINLGGRKLDEKELVGVDIVD